MAAEFQLEISTPERLFFRENADMVVLPSFDGEIGIMAGHEKMVSVLISGIIRIRQDGKWRSAASSEGYAMVYGDRVIVLAQSMEWPDEIDENRVHSALERSAHRLENPDISNRDKMLSLAAQGRAKARLSLLDRI